MSADRLHGAGYERKPLVLDSERLAWLEKLSTVENSNSPIQQAIGLLALLVELYSIADPRVAAAVTIAKPIAEKLYARATGSSNSPMDGTEVRNAYTAIRDLFKS